MPRCQHEGAAIEIELTQLLTAGCGIASHPETIQMRLAVLRCPACGFTGGVYRAYPAGPGGVASGDPALWPKWLLRLVADLRRASPALDAACIDRSVPDPEAAQ